MLAALIAYGVPSASAAALDGVTDTSEFTIEGLAPARLVGSSGVVLRYEPSLSVDCSPPRGCYARSQRLRFDFNCSPRFIVLVERTSFDRNGNELKREVADPAPAYAPAADSISRAVLAQLCPIPEPN